MKGHGAKAILALHSFSMVSWMMLMIGVAGIGFVSYLTFTQAGANLFA